MYLLQDLLSVEQDLIEGKSDISPDFSEDKKSTSTVMEALNMIEQF